MLLRTLGFILGFLILLGLFVYWNSSRRIDKIYSIKKIEISVPTSREEIEEGKRLFISRGCADCHGNDLAGVTFINDPAIGTYAGSNLTSGKNGISTETDASAFESAIRHGVGKNGRALLFMPATDFYLMTDQDFGRIIAYIKSVPAKDSEKTVQIIGPLGRVLFVLGKMPVLVSAEAIDPSKKVEARIEPKVTLEYGKYIATTCTGCHRESLLGGPIPGAPPEWPPATSITAKGLGNWTEIQFISAIRTGIRPDGSKINPIMPWKNFALMTDVELKALHLYLTSL